MARYWFKQKKFGYGATPSTWQGWVLSIFGCLLLFGVVLRGPAIRDNSLRVLWLILGSTAVVVPTTVIAYFKTEGGWRWRSGRDE